MSRSNRQSQSTRRSSGEQASARPGRAAWLRAMGWLARFTSSAASAAARSTPDEAETVFMGPATMDPRGTASGFGGTKSHLGSALASQDSGVWTGTQPSAGWPTAVWGGLLGFLLAALLWWPARWLPDLPLPRSANTAANSGANGGAGPAWVLRPTSGTWWQGQALLVQTSAGAVQAQPPRPVPVSWDVRPTWGTGLPGLKLRLAPGCCGQPALQAVVLPHRGGWWVQVRDGNTRWPLEWLAPLGVPVQALQLSGELWIDTAGLSWRSGHAFSGEAVAQAVVHSNLTPGAGMSAHYQARLRPSTTAGGVALGGADGVVAKPAVLELRTLGGALQLTGDGEQTEQGWRFRGTAQASGEASALRSVIEAALPPGKPSVFSWGKAS